MEGLNVYTETGEVRNGQAVVKVGEICTSQFALAAPLMPGCQVTYTIINDRNLNVFDI